MARKTEVRRQVAEAVAACEDKKAENVVILQLDQAAGGFTDYFVICSGTNPRQIQAISDEVEDKLARAGLRPTHIEGYKQADWVLLDYVDFVVHVFSEKARNFYHLERLWKSASAMTPAELRAAPARVRAPRAGRTGARRPRRR